MTTGAGEDGVVVGLGVGLVVVTTTVGAIVASGAEQLALLQISLSGITVML